MILMNYWRSSRIAVASLAAAAILSPSVSFADCTASTTVATPAAANWGYQTTNQHWFGQSFSAACSGTLSSILLYAGHVGTVSDHTYITLEADSAGSPSGTPLATSANLDPSATVAGASGPWAASTYTFSSPPSLSSGATYWIVTHRTGSDDTSAYYAAAGESGGTGAKTYASGTWSAAGNSMVYQFTIVGGASGGGADATSTVDQAQQNLSTAFLLFFVAMFGMIWLLRKH